MVVSVLDLVMMHLSIWMKMEIAKIALLDVNNAQVEQLVINAVLTPH